MRMYLNIPPHIEAEIAPEAMRELEICIEFGGVDHMANSADHDKSKAAQLLRLDMALEFGGVKRPHPKWTHYNDAYQRIVKSWDSY